MAAPIVGENSIGMRLAWRSFQAAIRRSASSSTFGLSDSEILHFVQSTGAPATTALGNSCALLYRIQTLLTMLGAMFRFSNCEKANLYARIAD